MIDVTIPYSLRNSYGVVLSGNSLAVFIRNLTTHSGYIESLYNYEQKNSLTRMQTFNKDGTKVEIYSGMSTAIERAVLRAAFEIVQKYAKGFSGETLIEELDVVLDDDEEDAVQAGVITEDDNYNRFEEVENQKELAQSYALSNLLATFNFALAECVGKEKDFSFEHFVISFSLYSTIGVEAALAQRVKLEDTNVAFHIENEAMRKVAMNPLKSEACTYVRSAFDYKANGSTQLYFEAQKNRMGLIFLKAIMEGERDKFMEAFDEVYVRERFVGRTSEQIQELVVRDEEIEFNFSLEDFVNAVYECFLNKLSIRDKASFSDEMKQLVTKAVEEFTGKPQKDANERG